MQTFVSKVYSRTSCTFFILFFIHFLVALWRIFFVIYGNTDLQSEEAQYWMWSEVLDWSYYSKPPMVAYLNYLSTSLLGDTEIGVRINAIIAGFLIPFIIFFFTKELFKSNRKAFIASVLVYAMPFYQGISLFFSTDTPLLLFWTLYLYLFWLALKTNKWSYWLLSGFVLGCGLLSKYSMFMIIPVHLLFCILYNRSVLKQSKIYISLLVAFLCFLPVIIWNAEHDFVSFRHVSGIIDANKTPKPKWHFIIRMLEYTGGQIGIISPLFIVMYFKIFKKYSFNNKIFVYLILAPVITFFVFLVVAIKNRSGANVNWPMFAYASLPVLLAHYIVDFKKTKAYRILFSITVILLLLLTQTSLLDKAGLGSLLPPPSDPAKKIVGWEQLGRKISTIKSNIPNNKCFVFSSDYHITTEMSFYMDGQPKAYYANMGKRMTQFDFWKGIEQFENRGYAAIYIEKVEIGKKKNAHLDNEKELDAEIRKAFEELTDYRQHYIQFRGKKMYLFHIYVLQGFKELETLSSGH